MFDPITPSLVVAKDRSNDEPVRRAGKRISVPAVWREALSTFSNNAPLILFVALIGFAGPAIVCILLSAVLRLNFYGQASGPLVTWLGLSTLRGGPVNPVSLLVWLQAGLGAVGLAFARGVIAVLALRDSDATDAPSLAVAWREAKARFLSLLIGSLVYGAVVAAGAVGVNAVLRGTDLDMSNAGRRSIAVPGRVTVLALRALDAFVPSPGSPFAEFVPLLRHAATPTRLNIKGFDPRLELSHPKYREANATPTPTTDNWQFALALSGMALIFFAETLLRFTPVMAVNAYGRTQLVAVAPVWRSVWFGIRHFGTITTHVWLLRLAFVVAYSAFFMLPVVLSQDAAPFVVKGVTSSVMGHWYLPLTLTCYWLVMALFMAFSTVYDARLVLALVQKADVRTVVRPTLTLTPEDRATVAVVSTSG